MASNSSSTAGVVRADEEVEKATAEKEAAGLVPVVVTTALPTGRSGVFFGWADPIAAQSGGDRIELQSARNVFFWAENNGGVLALATEGPRSGSKVGATAPKLLLRYVSAIVTCTPEAARAWGASSWE